MTRLCTYMQRAAFAQMQGTKGRNLRDDGGYQIRLRENRNLPTRKAVTQEAKSWPHKK